MAKRKAYLRPESLLTHGSKARSPVTISSIRRFVRGSTVLYAKVADIPPCTGMHRAPRSPAAQALDDDGIVLATPVDDQLEFVLLHQP